MDENINILIVEDHALTSFALKTSFLSCNFINNVYEASNANEAYKILNETKINLIIMDLGLDGTDGISATSEIRKNYKDIKIIILTSHTEKDEVQKCLQLGINAYCTKDIKPDKLIRVANDVLNGSMYFDSAVSKYVMQSTSNKPENKIDNLNIKDCYNLTQQEKRVLILLSTGYNNSQIAHELNISVNTTKVHVCSILQKMKVDDRTQAAIKAIREGLIE